ncbi:hypothetical protein OKJ48_34180 [Streptomyces kunmingensis]|uniref:Transposase (putative) YhgA-like domain-containing protein n=1 Tax=Streptomyces kunmingensis TaxID=68225 RepID=A0ABU6CME3_9ACTN|nr:hypothetical protein [Streptomyces kunmingensis]MEB3965237.1 hypothetical protein [Streptomyces kunmingensis]
MVSPPHEAMHRIFQQDPDLFTRVSRLLGLKVPAPTKVTVMPTDLTEGDPLERRVDTLLNMETEEFGPYLLAVEAQGKKHPDKPATWAYYVAYLWSKYRRPTTLLVVCQDRRTAEWAAQPVSSGPPAIPGLTVQPLVIGPHNMPRITSAAEARKDPTLAAFSAITHAADERVDAILKALSTALRDDPEGPTNPLIEFVAKGLSKRPAAQQWRHLMAVDLSFYNSDMSEEIRDEGRVQGRAQGRAQGEAKAVLRILEKRGVLVSDEARERIASCADLDTLDLWLDRSVTAVDVAELFVEDDGEAG